MATYTSAASGLWSAGATWVGGVKPPSGAGHKINIAPSHTVTYDEAAGEYGDDTSSTTSANNGIVVLGTLMASRSVSTDLTVRGTLFEAAGGAVDWGSTSDPIPGNVAAVLRLNYSLALASGKHGMTSYGQVSAVWRFRGKTRKRNTALSDDASAGAATISVADDTGWEAGDQIVIASDTLDPTRAELVTISGTSPNWTVSPLLSNARAAGTEVGNLSSNVIVRAHTANRPAAVSFAVGSLNSMVTDIAHVRFENIGNISGWVGGSQGHPAFYGLGFMAGSSNPVGLTSCAIVNTARGNYAAVSSYVISKNAAEMIDNAIYMPNGGTVGFYGGQGGLMRGGNNVVYDVNGFVQSSSGAGMARGDFVSDKSWARNYTAYTNGGDIRVSGGRHYAASTLHAGPLGKVAFEGSEVRSGVRIVTADQNAVLTTDLKGCVFAGTTLGGNLTTNTSAASPLTLATITAANGDVADNRVLNQYVYVVTDSVTHKRSTYSVRVQPRVAGTLATYVFAIPGLAGVQQTIKGSLRFDATYGTTTPPRIDLSGQGVTQTKTCAAVADAWDDFTFTFTPTSTGDITATVTVQSASTAGFAWLDGVYHYPMTQSVRHYGYQFLAQAALVANDKLSVTNEATVLAYLVAVDHGTSTITVSGNATATQIGDYLEADLCQTANQAQAVHYTLGVGGAFTTSYEVIIGSGVAITGAYTDALGLHVAVEATLPTTGCQIQLYDVTADMELDNREVAGTAYSYPITYDTYTAGHTLRLRVAQAGASAAKLPQEVFAALTTGGAVFTVPDEDDPVYASNGINGSTCDASGGGEFTADYPNLQIDVSDVDGMTSVQRVYAWSAWANTTTLGIRLMFGAVEALDTLNYVIHQDVVDAKFDNVNGAPVLIAGGYIRRADGTTVIAATSNSIQMDPGRAYVAPSIESDVAAIKAKTDNLPAAPAAVGDIPTAAQNADKLLGRNLAGAADGGRTVRDALRASRNKSQLSGGTLTVYREDDATPAWTADVTTASRDPVSGIDPT